MNMTIVNIMLLQFNALVRRYCCFAKLPDSVVWKRKLYLMDLPSIHQASFEYNTKKQPARLHFNDCLFQKKDGSGDELTEEDLSLTLLADLINFKRICGLRFPDLPLEDQYRRFIITQDGEEWDIVAG